LQSPYHLVVSRFELPAVQVQHLVRRAFDAEGVTVPAYGDADTVFVATRVRIDRRDVTYRARLAAGTRSGVWLLFLDGFYQYPGDSTQVSLQPSPLHISPRAWDKLARVAKDLYARRRECVGCSSVNARPVDDPKYVNPAHKWSINYPAGWGLDTQNLAMVRLELPTSLPRGLVGIHVASVAVQTTDELVDLLLESQQRSGQPVRVLSRRTIQLADGTPAVELETELGRGRVGRSRRVIAVVDRTAYVLDAETYSDQWAEFAPYVERIVTSFRLNR